MRYGDQSPFSSLMLRLYDQFGVSLSLEESRLLTNLASAHKPTESQPKDRAGSAQQTEEETTLDGSATATRKTSDLNGGWNPEPIADAQVRGDESKCDILEVWTGLPSAQEFFEKYLSKGRPVIFRRALQLQNHSLLSLFQKDEFLSSYGADSIPIAQIPYAHTFGKQQRLVQLSEVCPLEFFTFLTPRSMSPNTSAPPLSRRIHFAMRRSMHSMCRSRNGESGWRERSSFPLFCKT
jgi:hypothetical protein